MIEREKYLEEQISHRLQYWINKMLLLGIVFFPFIGIADYFVTPENLKQFTLYRIAISCVLLAAYYLNNKKRSTRYQHTLIAVVTILSAVVIEAMILQFGGHASPYYAGMNLLIIAAVGLIPYGLFLSLSVAVGIYLIYLLPIFLFDTITDPSAFLVNNVFMICTFVLVLTWRTLSQKSLINELILQYDLLSDKHTLEEYSLRLEHAMQELNKSEQWHRSLFENATDGILVSDRSGVIVNVNEKACMMHGFAKEALVGAPIELLEDGRDKERLGDKMRLILAGEAPVFETVHKRRDGTLVHLESSSKAIAIGEDLFIQSFYRDITEKKKLQEHFFQSQKMESIGVLAGGIAHDFNNVLTAILGHTAIVRLNPSLDEKALRSIGVIEDASRRAGRMISKLLGFARRTKYELAPVNLSHVVQDTVKLLEQIIDKKISLSLGLAEQLPDILCDINQMEQIIMNFVVNARDAMPDGGRLEIRTSAIAVGKGMPDVPPYVPPGDYVLLCVSDTGSGIPGDIINNIFEPFFTTKEQGKGTGLGLSMVYGAVTEHRGYLCVASTPGAGSAFTVYLPVARATLAAGNNVV